LIGDHCHPGGPNPLPAGGSAKNGNLQVSLTKDGQLLGFTRVDTGAALFSAKPSFATSSVEPGYLASSLDLVPGDKDELIYGLGQGNWSDQKQTDWCGVGGERPVPLVRNGQVVDLLQRKFHIGIPFAYSTGGYGFLFNMPGYGNVSVGGIGVGGMEWLASASLGLDFWVTGLPAGEAAAAPAAPVYKHYADATGHSPPLRQEAMLFWQSRLRYKTSDVAVKVAERYHALDLPVGVLVVDYYNQIIDGDWEPDARCYPSLKNLSSTVRSLLNASTMFSVWPEAKNGSKEFDLLKQKGCLTNACLYGYAMDPTAPGCSELMWNEFIKPRYYDQGVTSFWLDETDGEGTGYPNSHPDGYSSHGYNTSYGPASVASNLWVNDWLKTFTKPVQALGKEDPLVLVRGVWAGGQRNGVVLWSSDVASTFEELTAQLNLGVHASLSGIPWWTSDVGGFGCVKEQPNNSTYMQELIVRWYQFGCFSPVFRTHGARKGHADPEVPKYCLHGTDSGGENEVWAYGAETQTILESYVRLRASLLPYIRALDANVTAHGVPTVRPLWWEFPADKRAVGVDDQYLWGPDYLVAPVTRQGVTSRSVYFPKGASWQSIWDQKDVVVGGVTKTVPAPLHQIPVYLRV
jgi:alpha-D-xyloside xylohydrolase